MRTLANRRPAGARTGVSLVAVLVTLSVIGAIAVLAIPTFFERHEVTLENACKLLGRDLRSAQNRAAFLREQALFELHEDGWQVVTADGVPLGRSEAGQATYAEDDVIRRVFSVDGVFEGVRITSIELGEDGAISIDRRGLTDDGGSIVIEFNGESRKLEIDRGTGAITVPGS